MHGRLSMPICVPPGRRLRMCSSKRGERVQTRAITQAIRLGAGESILCSRESMLLKLFSST